MDRTVKARELLERGAYVEAGEAFLSVGEQASAARAFVCAKNYRRAAECYERARKPFDAARLYLQVREWRKAAQLYAQAGDAFRADLAMQQLAQEEAQSQPKAQRQAGPFAPGETVPEGEIWRSIAAGDFDAGAKAYLKPDHKSGWMLLDEARNPAALKALGETLFLARDYAVAAEAFKRAGDDPRSAQCLSLAGLNEEAADLYMRCGQRVLAAQHLEKARAWEQAASIYQRENLLLEAARCHEKDDEPAKAAALYLKARKPDLALPLLQAVSPAHRHFAQCRLLAGKILFQKGQKDLALSLLAPLMQAEIKGEDGMETYYQLAVLLDQAGQVEKARALYMTLQKIRFDFKDVTERLKDLDADSAATAPAPGPSGTPAQPAAPPADRVAAALPEFANFKDCSLFSRLDLDQLRRLYGAGQELECQPGQVMLKAGQKTDGLYVVLSGGLTITPNPENADLAVGFLGPGDYVGLGSLVQGPPQPNALVAQGGTRLLLLPAAALDALLSAEPLLGFRLFRSISENLVHTLMAEVPRPKR
jgi:tetratricopeptide (TPR) repeat protein